MGRAILRFLDAAKRWVRYAYFMRFAIALWLFAPLMCVLDTDGLPRLITSGVMTPETLQQYICVAFFLVSAGFVALICARVVLINGPARFDKCYDRHRRRPAMPAYRRCSPTTMAKTSGGRFSSPSYPTPASTYISS